MRLEHRDLRDGEAAPRSTAQGLFLHRREQSCQHPDCGWWDIALDSPAVVTLCFYISSTYSFFLHLFLKSQKKKSVMVEHREQRVLSREKQDRKLCREKVAGSPRCPWGVGGPRTWAT